MTALVTTSASAFAKRGRSVCWPTHIEYQGEAASLVDLVNKSLAIVEVRGNGAEGWAVYFGIKAEVEADSNKMQQVSPLFHRDQGDTRKALFEAAKRHFGDAVPSSVLAFHPAREYWIGRTVEAPKAEPVEEVTAEVAEAPAVKQAEKARVSETLMNARIKGYISSAAVRFGEDFDAAIEWLEIERSQELYIANNTRNKFVAEQSLAHAMALAAAVADVKARKPADHPRAIAVRIEFRNDNPNTIFNRLAAKLGRQPTNAEVRDEVRRIISEAEAA